MQIEVERLLAGCRSDLKEMNKGVDPDVGQQKMLVTIMQSFTRLLSDVVRGEYRDRITTRHPNVRLYTRILDVFEKFGNSISSSCPPFKDTVLSMIG